MAKAEKAATEGAAPEKKSKVSRGVVAKKSADKGEDSERSRKYPEATKIKVLNKENPHREGTGRAEAFKAMLGCKTMGDYYETGHKIKYIGQWVDSKHIDVG